MAVKQSHAWIVSHEVYFHLLIASQHHYILEHTCRGLSSYAHKLKAVPVQMDRMNIVAGIAHAKPIPLSLFQVKCRGHGFAGHRIGHTIDRPAVEAFFRRVVLRKSHLEGFVGWGGSGTSFREPSIAPLERQRRNP